MSACCSNYPNCEHSKTDGNPDLEELKKTEHSPAYKQFLEAVEKNGAYVEVLESKEGEEKKIKRYNIKKGSKNHGITDEMLIGCRPLTRREQRALFHTPYKYGRRVKA